MKVQVRGERIELTEALKDYTEKKLRRLDKYFETPPASGANVTLSVVRDMHTAEVTIPLPGVMLRAEERNTDMYASIDLVVDKLERQIRKHKTKINRKFRQDGSIKTGVFRENGEANAAYDEEDDIEVVRTKRFAFKPMDVEEAILRMNMIGHSFFVFTNMDTEKTNVIYKRNDGKYGLIEPEM